MNRSYEAYRLGSANPRILTPGWLLVLYTLGFVGELVALRTKLVIFDEVVWIAIGAGVIVGTSWWRKRHHTLPPWQRCLAPYLSGIGFCLIALYDVLQMIGVFQRWRLPQNANEIVALVIWGVLILLIHRHVTHRFHAWLKRQFA